MCFSGVPCRWFPLFPLGGGGQAGGSVSLLCVVRPVSGLSHMVSFGSAAVLGTCAVHVCVYLHDREPGQGKARSEHGDAYRGSVVPGRVQLGSCATLWFGCCATT